MKGRTTYNGHQIYSPPKLTEKPDNRPLLLRELEAFLKTEKENVNSLPKINLALSAIEWAKKQEEVLPNMVSSLWSERLLSLAQQLNLPFSVVSKLPDEYIRRLDVLRYFLKEHSLDPRKGLSVKQALSTSDQALLNVQTLYPLIGKESYTYDKICSFDEKQRIAAFDEVMPPSPTAVPAATS